jgi:mRNA-degrading endonuclease toxin of MazEF toxin-antitoxin module
MTDKIVTVAKSELGSLVGTLTDEQMHVINKQIARLLVITEEEVKS